MLKLQFKDCRQAPVWLAEERITLGQDHRNTLVLPDAGVSLFHAEIRREEGHYYLSDCASEAGTLVNGERISSRYQIRADDLLQVGAVELQFIDPMKVQAKVDTAKKWFLQVLQGVHHPRIVYPEATKQADHLHSEASESGSGLQQLPSNGHTLPGGVEETASSQAPAITAATIQR